MNPLFTIGHSNHTIERFLFLLQAHEVATLADVRSRPYSGRHPQFNREELEGSLKQAGIRYVFLGEKLGGRPDDPHAYREDGQVDYRRWRKSHAFQQGIELLIRNLEQGPVAMMCAEEDPLECHRFLMNCAELKEVAALHIRGDGREETQEETEDRLLREVNFSDLGRQSLFGQDAERAAALQEAYDIQAVRCAFRWKPTAMGGPVLDGSA